MVFCQTLFPSTKAPGRVVPSALLVLAIEPLAVLLRTSGEVQGIPLPPLVEKVSLYTDDTLFYLRDVQQLLTAAPAIIDCFGSFLGIRVNWDKSLLFSLTDVTPPANSLVPLQRVSRFKYLGIHIQNDPKRYLEDNLYPILQQFL